MGAQIELAWHQRSLVRTSVTRLINLMPLHVLLAELWRWERARAKNTRRIRSASSEARRAQSLGFSVRRPVARHP